MKFLLKFYLKILSLFFSPRTRTDLLNPDWPASSTRAWGPVVQLSCSRVVVTGQAPKHEDLPRVQPPRADLSHWWPCQLARTGWLQRGGPRLPLWSARVLGPTRQLLLRMDANAAVSVHVCSARREATPAVRSRGWRVSPSTGAQANNVNFQL